jgi:hypothetical protein
VILVRRAQGTRVSADKNAEQRARLAHSDLSPENVQIPEDSPTWRTVDVGSTHSFHGGDERQPSAVTVPAGRRTTTDESNTVQFTIDGVDYEIELIDKNETSLRDNLAEVIAAVNHATARSAALRKWARTNGYEVADDDRIPADVIAAYEEAQAQ